MKMQRTFFHVVCWLADQIILFLSLILARQVLFLVGTMFALFFLGLAVSEGERAPAFCLLFDAGAAANRGWVSMLLFFLVWMIGGGILVSVMVAQYHKNADGYFRRWRILVRNHVVVLGWDKGMMAKVKQQADETGGECYVITQQDVSLLKKAFKNAGIQNVVVYKGDYDSRREWEFNLQVALASKVFIAGESNEDAHDARVRLLYGKLREFFDKQGIDASKKLRVNIRDFGLARKLVLKKEEGRLFENFHQNWATYLWSHMKLPPEISIELFVVGFGAMGKAVVLAMPDELRVRASGAGAVFVTDDDGEKVGKELHRYDNQLDKPIQVKEKSWETVLAMVQNSNDDQKVRVVVVAKKQSEKGLLCMMDILSHIKPGDKNLFFALDQEIEGNEAEADSAKLDIYGFDVILFGMKKGCPDVTS